MSKNLAGKKILLGITGCIAAYKIPELVRLLRAQACEVRVIISDSGTEFVTPMTMQALSGQAVLHKGNPSIAADGMDHISMAKWCDAMLICPATANTLAKLAHGMADSLLTSTALATTAPIMLAPAMNQNMWLNQATIANVACLKDRGMHFAGPMVGDQACGDFGPGRMLEASELLQCANGLFHDLVLENTRIMITAGATKEPIDPVRYISNHSSGLMGYSLAHAAKTAGAEVLLVAAGVNRETPDGVQLASVSTARHMREVVLENITQQDIYIGAAAVSDYRSRKTPDNKIKRGNKKSLNLELRANPDIIAELGKLPEHPFLVGFAAETEALASNAKSKLRKKGLDMIVANKVGMDSGFGDVENELLVLWQDGQIRLGKGKKQQLAHELIPLIAKRYQEAQYANKDT